MSRWTPRRQARAIRQALAFYRADLAEYDRRIALYGGVEQAPPELRQQMLNTSREMERLTGRLREIEERIGEVER